MFANGLTDEERRKLLEKLLAKTPTPIDVPAGVVQGAGAISPRPAGNNPYTPNPTPSTAIRPAPSLIPARTTTGSGPDLMAATEDQRTAAGFGQSSQGNITYDPPMSRSQRAKQEAELTQGLVAKPEKSFWKRLGSGALKGIRTWAEGGMQGGIGGLLGAAATGGVLSGVSKKGHAEWAKDRKVQQMWNRYGQEMEVEAAEGKRQLDAMKGVEQQLDLTGKGLDIQKKAGQIYHDAAIRKGYLDDGDIEKLRGKYGWDLPDVVDSGEFKEMQVNGITYIRRGSDPRWYPNTSLPAEMGEQYYQTTLPGGGTVPLKPGQAASTAVGVAQANAGRVERKERAIEQGVTDDRKLKGKAAGAQARIDSLLRARAAAIAAGEATTGIDTQIAAARGELAEAVGSRVPTVAETRAELARRGLKGKQIDAKIKQLLDAGKIK